MVAPPDPPGAGVPPDNAVLAGPYAHFSDLDLGEADVWLYTSRWDGVPSQLLEVAMTGVPLVASEVGGIGEVLGEDDAWPVSDAEDPDAYVAAIRAVLADPESGRERAGGTSPRPTSNDSPVGIWRVGHPRPGTRLSGFSVPPPPRMPGEGAARCWPLHTAIGS